MEIALHTILRDGSGIVLMQVMEVGILIKHLTISIQCSHRHVQNITENGNLSLSHDVKSYYMHIQSVDPEFWDCVYLLSMVVVHSFCVFASSSVLF